MKVNWHLLFARMAAVAIDKDYFSDSLQDIEWSDEFYTIDEDGDRYLDYDKIWDYVDKQFADTFGVSRYEVDKISIYH